MYTPRRSIRKAWLAMLGLALFASTGAAWADDPPDRVARLSFMRGQVSFQPAGGDDWTQASINRPLDLDKSVNEIVAQASGLSAGSH